MVFGFFKRKKKQPPKGAADPIAAYDGLIEDLERQAAAIRRSAATLLSLRGELTRDVERCTRKVADVEGRIEKATQGHDHRAEGVLQRDLAEAGELLDTSQKALAAAEADSTLLLEAAQDLQARTRELRAERAGARARLSVGLAVSGALRERAEKIEKVLALDAARDEVERAHALAEIYREEQKTRSG
ncbi:MAG: PspA/IM30 family protein [Myxococcaceae bacterium]